MRKKSTKIFLALTVICLVLFFAWLFMRLLKANTFENNCNLYIYNAVTADNAQQAKDNLEKAIEYIENHNLTSGTVSIFFHDFHNNLEIWYRVIQESYDAVNALPENSTPETEQKVIREIRKEYADVGLPFGISIYPNNTLYFWWSVVSLIGTFLFGGLWLKSKK